MSDSQVPFKAVLIFKKTLCIQVLFKPVQPLNTEMVDEATNNLYAVSVLGYIHKIIETKQAIIT